MKKYIYLILIIIVGIVLISLEANKKQVYDGDELYSYTLSNSKKGGFIINNINLNKWTSSKEIKDAFALNNDEIFSFISVYKNQAGDVHPPFYYTIFHVISILFINKFTILPGIIINLLAYIISAIYIYKLSEKLEINKYIPCILYTISIGLLSTTMFIRMYMLLTMFCLIFTHYFIKVFENQEKKDLIKLSICTYLGFMTHYFFLVYAFFISSIYIIYLLINKKQILKYVKSMIITIILGFITFPFAYNHIFRGYRGEETQTNLIKSNIIDNFKSIYERLNQDIFYGIMPVIIVLIIILLIKLIKNKKSKNYMSIIMISTLLYFMLTLKIIPIKSTRYFYPIYPIIIIIICYLINNTNKYIKQTITLTLIILSVIAKVKYKPSWIGTNNIKQNNQNVIYIIKDDYTTISDSQYLIKYNKTYFTNEEFNNYKIIDESKEIIIKTENIELLDKIIKNTKYKEYEKEEFGYKLK